MKETSSWVKAAGGSVQPTSESLSSGSQPLRIKPGKKKDKGAGNAGRQVSDVDTKWEGFQGQ